MEANAKNATAWRVERGRVFGLDAARVGMPRTTRVATRSAGAGLWALALGAIGCGVMPEVSVQLEGEATTSESGASVDVTVALARRPKGVITVEARSSDPSEGSVSAAVRFDRANWQEPQIITVTGVDDGDVDGDVTYTVELLASSSLRHDEPYSVEVLQLVNRDDERVRFTGLGDLPGGEVASYASSLSAAGDVVVGWSEGEVGAQAIRWSPAAGLQALSAASSRAHGVSPNGKLIVGSSSEAEFSGGIWRGDEPFDDLFRQPDPPEKPVSAWLIVGRVVLDDGRVFGLCGDPFPRPGPTACRIDEPGEIDHLGLNDVYDADEQGNFAGYWEPRDLPTRPFEAAASFNGHDLGFPSAACFIPHSCRAEARAFSQAGKFIVGTSKVEDDSGTDPSRTGPLYDVAFLHVEGEGVRSLPDLEGGERASGAFAINHEGDLIGGYGTDAEGQQAVLWVDGHPFSLLEILARADAAPPPGFQLREVLDITPDGLALVGNGVNPDGNSEGFRVAFPAPVRDILAAAPDAAGAGPAD